MVANLTTPLIGIVSTMAIGRLGDATLLGGVAMASVLFDCMFWLFGVPAHEHGRLHGAIARRRRDARNCARSWCAASSSRPLIGAALIALQAPLAGAIYRLMGASAE